MLLVDVPISIRFSIKSVIYHIIRITGYILCISSGIFAIMSSIIVFVIFVFHIYVFLFDDAKLRRMSELIVRGE